MMHADGTVHFSDLKQIAKSPAHYAHSVTQQRETTRPMRIGSIVDRVLLTDEDVPVYAGDRRGKGWDGFVAANPGRELYTQSEWDDAQPIIRAAQNDPMAQEYLGLLETSKRRTQVPLRWETNGVPRSTRGIDVLYERRLVDLKVTNTTQPGRLVHHARNMLWHAQLADYTDACEQNLLDVVGLYLVCIEATAPHCVTVLELDRSAIEAGHRCIAGWIETYKVCASSGSWPGYAQSPVDMTVLDLEGFNDE